MSQVEEVSVRIIETTGIQPMQEDSPEMRIPGGIGSRSEYQEYLDSLNDSGDEDESPYPGKWNIWVCYGENPCQVCMDNMAVGPVRAGEAFPSGHTTPPAHDHCECDLEAADPDNWRWPIVLPPRRRKKRPEKLIPIGTLPSRPEDESEEK